MDGLKRGLPHNPAKSTILFQAYGAQTQQWSCPPDVYTVVIEGAGGGGCGGGNSTNCSSGGGGSAISGLLLSVNPGALYSISIGQGSSTIGSNGGATTMTDSAGNTVLNILGGIAGVSGGSNTPDSGFGYGGDGGGQGLPGQSRQDNALALGGANGATVGGHLGGGGGGAGWSGAGGIGSDGSSTGAVPSGGDASGYGSGGGGAGSGTSGAPGGGHGTDGCLIIRRFYLGTN